MTRNEIEAAVKTGKTVCWGSESYQVIDGGSLGLLVKHRSGFCSGLTDEYDMSDFFIKEPEAPTYVKAVFTIDGECPHVGIHNPKRYWNGWAIPYFTKEEAMRFVKNSPINEDCTWAYNEAKDEFVFTESIYAKEEDYQPDTYPAEMIDGQKLYSLGGCSLIWSAEEDKVFFHKDRSGRDGHGNVSLLDIVSDPDNIEEYDEAEGEDKEVTLIHWAIWAEIGDEWSDNANQYTRIS